MGGYLGTKAVLLSTTAANVVGNATISGDLTVDTDTLYVDSTNNQVGIGTSSPNGALDVNGDLYLSGGVYLGGTGSANLLDDYEEGTFTPTVAQGTLSSSFGNYTKIGRVVTVHMEFGGFSDTSSTQSLTVNNLPFVSAGGANGSSQGSTGSQFSRYCSPSPDATYQADASNNLSFYADGGTGVYAIIAHNHLTNTDARFYVHATYRTA